jgi:hypothetical protein
MKQILRRNACCAGFLLIFSYPAASLGQQGPAAPLAKNPQPSSPPPSIPTALVSDWRLLGVDPDLAGRLKKSLDLARSELIKKWAGGGTLEQYTARTDLKRPELLKKFTTSTAVSSAVKAAAVGASLVYEPLLCRLGDRYVVHISATDTVLGNLRGAAHTSIAARDLQNPVNAETSLAVATTNTVNRLAVTSDGNSQDNSALHIGMSLGRETTRKDEGSSFCALALLAEMLIQEKFTVVRPWGGETLASIRNALTLPAKLRRPTRMLSFIWQIPRAGKQSQNPMPLRATINIAESILGQTLPAIPETVWNAQIDADGKITLTAANQSLMDFLRQERQSLSLAEAPQIAKVDRAWVYLDKGRAYGLEMDDRLVISGGAKDYAAAVKGHVVGFYGPEKKIKSPRGFPVNEGAIVFIRKGQGDTKIGQTFIFDETVYPANFPASGR